METIRILRNAENRAMALSNCRYDFITDKVREKLRLAAGYLQRARHMLIEPESFLEQCYNMAQDALNDKTPFLSEPDWKRFLVRALAKQMVLNPKIPDKELHEYRRLMLLKYGLKESNNPTEYNRFFLSYEDFIKRYDFTDLLFLNNLLNELGGKHYFKGFAKDISTEEDLKTSLDDLFEQIVKLWINESLDLNCRLYLVQAKYKIEELSMLLTIQNEEIYS